MGMPVGADPEILKGGDQFIHVTRNFEMRWFTLLSGEKEHVCRDVEMV